MAEFLDIEDYDDVVVNKGSTQRIVLVAANFRKEVTSTVLWLLTFKMSILMFQGNTMVVGN